MAGAIQDNLFIGRRAQELRGLLKIKYPMEHGVVTDWDDMERIWGWVYAEGLKALSEEVGSDSGSGSGSDRATSRHRSFAATSGGLISGRECELSADPPLRSIPCC
jgi:centractin